MIVGQTAVLNCSTQLDVTKMEWTIVGLGFPVAASYTQEVVLTLELSSTGLDGAMFTCRATTAAGNEDCTVTIYVKGEDIDKFHSSSANTGTISGSILL